MTEKITFENIRFCYGEVCAINNANFDIKKNGITAFVGPNGGGKSTLVKLLVGLLKPSLGKIKLWENAVIGYVPQVVPFDTSFPATVRELVLMGTQSNKIAPFKYYSKKDKQTADEAIQELSLQGLEQREISQLSLGQLKRTLIARALASKADILVLDEPDESLDINTTRDLYEIISRLKKDKTIIIVSHRIADVLEFADSALYIRGTAKLYDNPKELKEILLKDGIFGL
ncbi:MAG: metal ABC transporter ATP-binding protein [Clostridia bacterium]|nr:metal ABC transporter ATP-binding protein [Clostridia bacterium]